MSPIVSREVSTEDEEELQDEDDSPEAFLDIEEDDILCQGYNPRPTVQVLHAHIVYTIFETPWQSKTCHKFQDFPLKGVPGNVW